MDAKSCLVNGCEKKILARGYCRSHYYRYHRYGDPLGAPIRNDFCVVEEDGEVCGLVTHAKQMCYMHYELWKNHGHPLRRIRKPQYNKRKRDMPKREFVQWLKKQRRLALVDESLGKCWEWTRTTNAQGYGCVSHKGRMVLVHRLMKEIELGYTLLPKVVVCHLCHNPLCYNPAHLALGDKKINKHDDKVAGKKSQRRIGDRPAKMSPTETLVWLKAQGQEVLHVTELGPCLEWTGALSSGYGTTSWRGTNMLVHRLIVELESGETLLPGFVVRHLCHNPKCYNPKHLAIGDRKQNSRDTKLDRMKRW